MAKIMTDIETVRQIDAQGNESKTVTEKTKAIEISNEPDFIKLYTKMWCEFNSIPVQWRELFLQLATRMSYCNKTNPEESQIVHTCEPTASVICKTLGWKQKDSLMKGLRALQKCNAIKKISRGVYQINPSYASRGEWKYNPRLERGGVEDLVATFDFRAGTVSTTITWTPDDNPGTPTNVTTHTFTPGGQDDDSKSDN